MLAGFNCGELLRIIRRVDRDACGIDFIRFRQIERFLGNVPKNAMVQCTPDDIDFLMSLPERCPSDA